MRAKRDRMGTGLLFLFLLGAVPGSLFADAGIADQSGRYLVANMQPAKRDNGNMLVCVDAEKHIIAIYEFSSKFKTMIPIAMRNYTYDLLIKEFPHEKLKLMEAKGISSWNVREKWEEDTLAEMKKNGDDIDDYVKKKPPKKLEPPIGTGGVGKTLLMTFNTIASAGDSAKEYFAILDMGSNTKDTGAVALLTYAVDFDGPAAGAIVPKGIRRISDEFKLAEIKLNPASKLSYNGDLKNPQREQMSLIEVDKLLRSWQEKENKPQ